MRLFMMIALPGLALGGCFPSAALPPPAAIADRTVVDEKAALGIEIAYSVAGRLLELAVDTGRLRGTAAARADAIDARIASAVAAARLAYDAGNAADYRTAHDRAQALIEELTGLATGRETGR